MDINIFIQNIIDQYDDIDTSGFTKDTKFKEVEGWNSLLALSIIAMVDDEYSVVINNVDLRHSETIQDLYNIVSSKV